MLLCKGKAQFPEISIILLHLLRELLEQYAVTLEVCLMPLTPCEYFILQDVVIILGERKECDFVGST